MLNLKSEKGSITLVVLVSCMFFIASVICVQIYMQSKQIAVDREYKQIKLNYEGNIINNDSLDKIYYQLSQLENLNIIVGEKTRKNNQLIVEFSLNNTSNIDVTTIKYGWGTSSTIDTVSQWSYIEKEGVNEKMLAINNDANSSDEYNLFIVVGEKEFYENITF